ncbi:MAG TPA: hypothetical protein VL738_04670 [Dactylosporangium sp.]|jgi:hypothetical protein|nr:hypothetical protein [Dactylosporangium sp.]
MRWPWVVIPPLLVLGAAALVRAFDPGGYVLFGVAGLAGFVLNQLLTDLRRRDEPPARPGWQFHSPAKLASARAGRAFAAALMIVAVAVLAGARPFELGAAVVLASVSFVTGVQLLVRLVRRTPVLRLSASGVQVRGRRYPWERIAGVELNGDRDNPRLDLLVAGRRHPEALRPDGVDANLLFLVDLLGYYAAHPHLRSAIGDEAEARRVHALLLDARIAAGLRGGPQPILIAPPASVAS